ncbi:MAG TPA: DUF2934 domain-containing protein [Candidatus Binatia bacterium]|nr:DUF2934 domain-containing protein [Candidatus Binatia bacterium]
MESDLEYTDRVRARRYPLYQQRTVPNRTALDDWLQAEAEIQSENQRTTDQTKAADGRA